MTGFPKTKRDIRKNALFVTALMICALIAQMVYSPKAYAHFCPHPTYQPCSTIDCLNANAGIIQHHEQGETQILAFMRERFHQHRAWFMEDYLPSFMPQMLMLMTQQMSAMGMYQMLLVGKFFDSKLHLETQRLFQEMQTEAAKDYQPSDSFCYFGTNARSLSHSESLAIADQGALNKIAFNRHLGNINAGSTTNSSTKDARARWDHFTTTYCDPHDNNWYGGTSGLVDACGGGAADIARRNIDVDYTRLIEDSRYLDVDFNNNVTTPDEQDVIALSNNLYGHDSPQVGIPFMSREASQDLYLGLRSVIAKRGVAQNSYNAIVAMKSRGSGGGGSAPYFRSLMQDLGMGATDINEIFGENPSYYAQLEALGKKMFQNTDFFTDLHDNPANVLRKEAALNAIELMLDRVIFESEQRHEMMMSVLLSSNLEKEKASVFKDFSQAR